MLYLYQTEIDLLKPVAENSLMACKRINGVPLIGQFLFPESGIEFMQEVVDFINKPAPIAIEDENTAQFVYDNLAKPSKRGSRTHKFIPLSPDSPDNIINNLIRKLEKTFPGIKKQ
jgi:hypothetical protein